MTYRDQLFYWFKHSGQLDRIPEFIHRSPRMAELAKACERGSFTPEKKLEYERLMLNELDKINMVRQAEKRALAKGREEGKEEGVVSVAFVLAGRIVGRLKDLSETTMKCSNVWPVFP